MPLPRALFTLALLWGLAAFVATVGVRAPVQPATEAYAQPVRGLLALLATGLALLWPLARLAGPAANREPRRVLVDLAVLLVLLQGGFWPLHLVTGWTLERAAAIDLLLTGWAAVAGAAIALGANPARSMRVALAAMAVAAAGPALDAFGVAAPWPALAGPFAALAWLTAPGDPAAETIAWAVAAWPWTVAPAAWAWALASRPVPGAPCPGMPDPLP